MKNRTKKTKKHVHYNYIYLTFIYLFQFGWLTKTIEVLLQLCAYVGEARTFFITTYDLPTLIL
jgi:hypothetical protein